MRAVKLAALAMLLCACDGCTVQPHVTPPLPTSTAPPPQPVMADAGGGCEAACEQAHSRCAKPEITVAECVKFCTEEGKQMEPKSPRCRARILECSEVCAR